MTSSSSALLISAEDASPHAVLHAGRRVLRTWVTVCAAGWCCHPLSIVTDEAQTAEQLADLAGVEHPVALLRIGYARKRSPASQRRSLESMLKPSISFTPRHLMVS